MMDEKGILVAGELVSGRASQAWLADFAAQLNGSDGWRAFELLGGREIVGTLPFESDPLALIVEAALRPGAERMRWLVSWADLAGSRKLLADMRTMHDRLLIRTGLETADRLLAGMSPALMDILDSLTERQRVVARLALIEGLRQHEVAERLGIRRATVSVSFNRAKVHSIAGLLAAMRSLTGPSSILGWPRTSAASTPRD